MQASPREPRTSARAQAQFGAWDFSCRDSFESLDNGINAIEALGLTPFGRNADLQFLLQQRDQVEQRERVHYPGGDDTLVVANRPPGDRHDRLACCLSDRFGIV